MTEEISKRKWSRIGCLVVIAAIIIVMTGLGGIYGYYKYQTNKGIGEAAKRISTYLEQKNLYSCLGFLFLC